jgi:serine beta-lactamase-like protein LACTB, mitochondrial
MRALQIALIVGACGVAAVTVACGSTTQTRSRNGAGCRETKAVAAYASAIKTAMPLVRRLAAGIRAPGMSLAVAADGKIIWSVNCGYSNIDAGRLVNDHTRFRIGSVSKTLTAAALMHYAAVGKVDLDAPIGRYLQSFPSHGGGITLRRLAGHLAGIRHYETQFEAVNTRHFDSVAAPLAIFANDPLVAPPGTQFAYSSYGYDVIGAALERATNESFETLMRQAVFAPADLNETTIATAPAGRRSSFYELTSSGKVRAAPAIDLSDRLPAGGLLSTARDLARFGCALVDGTLVPAASARVMLTSQTTLAGTQTGYGIGVEVHASPFGTFVAHTGAVDGGTAGLLIHPRSRTALALATNLGYATADNPPPPRKGTPDPPVVLLPFIKR